MEWHDEGLILAVKQHGERNLLVEAMTQNHGRHFGLVRSHARGARALLQPGNYATFHWHARLAQHLGLYHIEIIKNYAASLCESRKALILLSILVAHLRRVPERDPHVALLEQAHFIIHTLTDTPDSPPLPLLLGFEFDLLKDMGFRLDLSTCALTESPDNLIWVSPSSGRAVSENAGRPWADKLLPLPPGLNLWQKNRADTSLAEGLDFSQALALTGYFLEKHLYADSRESLPEARLRLIGKQLS